MKHLMRAIICSPKQDHPVPHWQDVKSGLCTVRIVSKESKLTSVFLAPCFVEVDDCRNGAVQPLSVVVDVPRMTTSKAARIASAQMWFPKVGVFEPVDALELTIRATQFELRDNRIGGCTKLRQGGCTAVLVAAVDETFGPHVPLSWLGLPAEKLWTTRARSCLPELVVHRPRCEPTVVVQFPQRAGQRLVITRIHEVVQNTEPVFGK
mmetsp:Transcript_26334/g.61423  ORF Transcript_26334/g.61423 Transcript_26334/m.61423 type:complete len:208 (-) Transcript_26334:119-742(-)